MIRPALTVAAFFAGTLSAGAAQAQIEPRPDPRQQPFAIGAGVGTTGVYVEAQAKLASWFVVRGTYEFVDAERDQDIDDVTYSGQIESGLFGTYAQIHPLESAFFVTGGGLFGDRAIGLGAQPSTPVTIGNATFTPAQIGRLEGDADLGDRAAAFGIGWDTTFNGVRGLGWRIMAGAAIGQEPDVTLRSVGGSLSNDPTLQQALRDEEGRIEDEAGDVRAYPLLQVGLTYRF